MLADTHVRQPERLAALRAYDILDTPRERDFDDLVDLAAQLCGTPIALISLVGEDRQWFKAETGLGASETGLDRSICSHAILSDDLLEIADTAADPRTLDNPLCIGNGALRFYAGAPLLTENGLPIGTLCVLDDHPRHLTGEQRNALRVLARQVMKQLELRQALRERETLRREVDHRVKNSLQTVASLVRLYARGLSDPAAAEVLAAVQRRIDSVGALHEELQTATDARTLDAAAYLRRICSLLDTGGPEGVTLSTHLAHCPMPAEKAAALAMIVSEFTANSIKHGFPDGRHGTISVALERLGDARMRLALNDDGVGAQGRSHEPSRAEGLGRALVDAAATQLDGTLEHTIEDDGARLVLDFPG
ncbi:MAG: GAF domain-containing protein [Pseudooceanicola sp.]|nr:GAF domain-containing protein [Pseudooceanicola sp.]